MIAAFARSPRRESARGREALLRRFAVPVLALLAAPSCRRARARRCAGQALRRAAAARPACPCRTSDVVVACGSRWGASCRRSTGRRRAPSLRTRPCTSATAPRVLAQALHDATAADLHILAELLDVAGARLVRRLRAGRRRQQHRAQQYSAQPVASSSAPVPLRRARCLPLMPTRVGALKQTTDSTARRAGRRPTPATQRARHPEGRRQSDVHRQPAADERADDVADHHRRRAEPGHASARAGGRARVHPLEGERHEAGHRRRRRTARSARTTGRAARRSRSPMLATPLSSSETTSARLDARCVRPKRAQTVAISIAGSPAAKTTMPVVVATESRRDAELLDEQRQRRPRAHHRRLEEHQQHEHAEQRPRRAADRASSPPRRRVRCVRRRMGRLDDRPRLHTTPASGGDQRRRRRTGRGCRRDPPAAPPINGPHSAPPARAVCSMRERAADATLGRQRRHQRHRRGKHAADGALHGAPAQQRQRRAATAPCRRSRRDARTPSARPSACSRGGRPARPTPASRTPPPRTAPTPMRAGPVLQRRAVGDADVLQVERHQRQHRRHAGEREKLRRADRPEIQSLLARRRIGGGHPGIVVSGAASPTQAGAVRAARLALVIGSVRLRGSLPKSAPH